MSDTPSARTKPTFGARLRATLIAAILVPLAVAALGVAGTPLGAALYATAFHIEWRAFSVAGLELFGLFVYITAALALAARQRAGLGWIVVLAATAATGWSGWTDYKASISPSWRNEYHGIVTGETNSTRQDQDPHRPHVTYRSNKFGFRGDDFEEQKRPGVLRVALIGDSFMYGMGVEEPDSIKEHLVRELKARGVADRVEVLNLGVPGDNFGSHIRVYDIATRVLSSDVVVMGLLVANDLAEWDSQDEWRDLTRPSLFGAAAWYLGREPAVTTATKLFVQHGNIRRSLAALDRLLVKFDALRAADSHVPVIVLPFCDNEPDVAAHFANRPNLVFVHTRDQPDFYLPVDGHPNPKGTAAYAETLWTALAQTPPIRALLDERSGAAPQLPAPAPSPPPMR